MSFSKTLYSKVILFQSCRNLFLIFWLGGGDFFVNLFVFCGGGFLTASSPMYMKTWAVMRVHRLDEAECLCRWNGADGPFLYCPLRARPGPEGLLSRT